ncbi:MAG: hypothetical protein F4151_10840, partial [Gammaproteobacteria bacterium]|nr:hypothetical protein [Gammaproteobacteria bacterium]
MSARRDLLRLLAAMPFLDRLEMVALSGWSRGAVYAAAAALGRAGLVDAVPHASAPTPATRRYCLTAAGLRRLAEEDGSSVETLLRRRPVSEQWRRILLQRLDAAATVYRLASALSDAAYPIRLRWYRAMPMDAALALPDGRTLAVVRLGPTADRTAFAKRLWRLRGGPRPGALLLLVPDEARLRHMDRLMAGAPAITFLALERDVVASGPDARLWRTPLGPPLLSLREVLAHVGGGRSWPRERPLRRLSLPRPLPRTEAPTAPYWLLPVSLEPAGKRVLDLVADWPWIARPHLAALLDVSERRLGQALGPLEEAGLVARAPARRLVLTDRGLAVLARRDRASVGLARKRWSAAPVDP